MQIVISNSIKIAGIIVAKFNQQNDLYIISLKFLNKMYIFISLVVSLSIIFDAAFLNLIMHYKIRNNML